MNFGNWNIEVVFDKMPQKVATAMAKLNETYIGVEYEPIAYLGSQIANGTNHAILAKQIIVTGRDTTNIVVIIFNEKPAESDAALVSIERVVEGGAQLGGTQINVQTDILEEEFSVWNLETLVGSKVTPFAFLGSQESNGTNYIFAATIAPVTLPVTPIAKQSVFAVTINPLNKNVVFADLLSNKQAASPSYSFAW